MATGSPFPPVVCISSAGQAIERVIGQCNNCFVFPGLGYGAVAVGATEVSDAMIDASIEALARVIPAANDPEAPLMPPLSAVQEVSRAVAEAVAIAAVQEGLARHASTAEAAIYRLAACRWSPVYDELVALEEPPTAP